MENDDLLKLVKDLLWIAETNMKLNNPDWDGSATADSTVGKARAALGREQKEPVKSGDSYHGRIIHR